MWSSHVHLKRINRPRRVRPEAVRPPPGVRAAGTWEARGPLSGAEVDRREDLEGLGDGPVELGAGILAQLGGQLVAKERMGEGQLSGPRLDQYAGLEGLVHGAQDVVGALGDADHFLEQLQGEDATCDRPDPEQGTGGPGQAGWPPARPGRGAARERPAAPPAPRHTR